MRLRTLCATLALTISAAHAGPMEMETSNGIRHISGGVGGTERAKLAEAAEGFGMKLTFATASGAYRFDVLVSVLTADNKPLVSATSFGPIMYLDVPPGTYTVIADDPSTGQLQTVTVEAGKQASAVFRSKEEM